MFTSVDTSALLSWEVLCPSSPQVWLRTSQSLTRDLQHIFCSPPTLGTHQSHQTSSLCGLANIQRASCLFVVVALILLIRLVLSSQGSTYQQWPVGLVRPRRVFKHVESTRVEWPWQTRGGCMTQAHNLLSRRIVYSIYYNSTLVLPVSGEGRGCWGCCCCWLLKERTRSVILLQCTGGSIYSNNLVRTDHVCSCLVTSAAWEQINQSCDDHYPKYRFATYQRVTSWSHHQLPTVTEIHFT